MKAILTDEQALVYNSFEDQTISIATIHKGEVMDLGKVIRKKKKVWVEIALRRRHENLCGTESPAHLQYCQPGGYAIETGC